MGKGTGRQFARYLASNHRDPDWAEMTTLQHDCYMSILSSPDLSWAGVIPYFPARYIIAKDLTERKVARTWDELAELNKLVIDKRTGEVLVRTFMRHDNVLVKPNIVKAFCGALDRVASEVVRSAIAIEAARIRDEGTVGDTSWNVIADQAPELFKELFPEQFPKPLRGIVA